MNCQNFETVINDLAREQIMDAASRASGLAHASVCARCAARLADERMLSAGLRRLAASADAEQAPARVEARLLAAMREQKSLAPSTEAADSYSNRLLRWAIAAAAMILVAFAIATISFDGADVIERVERAQTLNLKGQLASPVGIMPVERENVIAATYQPRPVQKPPRRNVIHQSERPARAADPRASQEIATDFIPLVHGNSMNLMESGQLIRVELPRSALVSFGLPMNMERADELVKADEVVGTDGLARAIRFVR